MSQNNDSAQKLLWQRSIPFNGPFHLPLRDNVCSQDWHYFPTACLNEIKAPYGQWEITDSPDPKKCCKKCLAIAAKLGRSP